MITADLAAEHDQIMGDYSICHPCAVAKGGHPPHLAVTTWPGTCIVCNAPKTCCHVRDYGWPGGIRPRKAVPV